MINCDTNSLCGRRNTGNNHRGICNGAKNQVPRGVRFVNIIRLTYYWNEQLASPVSSSRQELSGYIWHMSLTGLCETFPVYYGIHEKPAAREFVLSRQIKRNCYWDVEYRIVAWNHQPDHTRISRFYQSFYRGACCTEFYTRLYSCGVDPTFGEDDSCGTISRVSVTDPVSKYPIPSGNTFVLE